MDCPVPLLSYHKPNCRIIPIKPFAGFLKRVQYRSTPPNINSPISAHPISVRKSNTAFKISRRIPKAFDYLPAADFSHLQVSKKRSCDYGFDPLYVSLYLSKRRFMRIGLRRCGGAPSCRRRLRPLHPCLRTTARRASPIFRTGINASPGDA